MSMSATSSSFDCNALFVNCRLFRTGLKRQAINIEPSSFLTVTFKIEKRWNLCAEIASNICY